MPADTPLLLGIDAGTTRLRALVFTPDGTLLAEGSAPTPTVSLRPDWAEHDPEALWQAAVAAIRAAVGRLDAPQRLVGLAVASVGEAAVPLDRDGRPTHPAIAWWDKRPAAEAAWLAETFGADALAATAGLRPDATLGMAKLLWLKRHVPDAYGRTVAWLPLADYLAWRLGGRMATDASLASRMLALDLPRLCWNEALVREAGLDPSLLPPLTPSGTALGEVSAEAAAATGLPRSCRVAVGGHDHIVASVAAGAWQAGTMVDSLGTAEALLLAVERPSPSAAPAAQGFIQGAIVLASGALGGAARPLYYAAGANLGAGASVEWLRGLFGDQRWTAALDGAAAVPPGSHGVCCVPHPRGDTADALARAAFTGLHTEAGPEVLARALLEGLAFDARARLDGLVATVAPPPIRRLRAVGGLTRIPLLMAIKAAVFDRPVTVVDMAEATSLGAALLGGLAAGVFDDIAGAVAGLAVAETEVVPDPALAAAYEMLYRSRYRPAAEAVRPLRAVAPG